MGVELRPDPSTGKESPEIVSTAVTVGKPYLRSYTLTHAVNLRQSHLVNMLPLIYTRGLQRTITVRF